MQPIEQVPRGALVFLTCGCAGVRGVLHPTGKAALVVIHQPCAAHAGEKGQPRSLRRGELVSPFVRPVHAEPALFMADVISLAELRAFLGWTSELEELAV